MAYFRPSLKAPPQDVLSHSKYIHPTGAAHFLWRDVYGPLTRGAQPLSIWLREGFEQLGYTPPLPHVGELVTDDRDESHAAQVDLGKLWDATKRALAEVWTNESGTPSTLFLYPRGPSLIDNIMLFATAQKGTLLRINVKGDRQARQGRRSRMLRRRSRAHSAGAGSTSNADARAVSSWRYDLEASLYLVLGDDADPQAQGERLLAMKVGPRRAGC